jgi:hypothetical protein
MAGALHARLLSRLSLGREPEPVLLSLRDQPAQAEPAARHPRGLRRLQHRALQRRRRPCHRDQRAERPRPDLLRVGDHRRCRYGVRLPAPALPRGRDRRRGILGRRLQRQPGAAPPRPERALRRHPHRSDQPGGPAQAAAQRARDHQPDQRDQFQRCAREGAARDQAHAGGDRGEGHRPRRHQPDLPTTRPARSARAWRSSS